MLLTRKGGRPSGEAFVVLASAFQLEAALGRNKSYLGRRYVEVFKSHKHVSSSLPYHWTQRLSPHWKSLTKPWRQLRQSVCLFCNSY